MTTSVMTATTMVGQVENMICDFCNIYCTEQYGCGITAWIKRQGHEPKLYEFEDMTIDNNNYLVISNSNDCHLKFSIDKITSIGKIPYVKQDRLNPSIKYKFTCYVLTIGDKKVTLIFE